MSELTPEQRRLKSMEEVFPNFEEILERLIAFEGLFERPIEYVKVYDEFVSSYNFYWDDEQQSYMPYDRKSAINRLIHHIKTKM